MTNVFIISGGEDVGGVAIAIQRAFERINPEGWTVRSMRGANNYIDYPVDFSWNPDNFKTLWEWADVIHAMEQTGNLTGIYNPPGKPIVLHHHGQLYRWNTAQINERMESQNLVSLVSTIDMLALSPRVQWLPNPVDVDYMQALRRQYKPVRRRNLKFVHSPTAFEDAKGTSQWKPAVRAVSGDFSVIRGATWAQALAHKATGDIHLDQLLHGYGNSGLEAMGMGLPVLSGGLPEVEQGILDKIGYLPYHMSMNRVREAVVEILDPDLRREVSEMCFQYVQDYHAQGKVVDQLIGFYKEAMDRYDPNEEAWV